jgi:cysteine desulfurase/selenocysteine lyase
MSSLDRRDFLKTTAVGLAAVPAVRTTTVLEAHDDPLGVRSDFAVTKNHTYLNTASVGPFPNVVKEAAIAWAEEQAGSPLYARMGEKREHVRQHFGELFGVKPEEVAVVYSTSDAENIVANGLDLKPGDNVVIDELHFTTTFVLYRQLEKDKGIELRIVPQKNGRSHLADFDARIDDRTRLVSVAWVSNRNGYRQDVKGLAEIAHSKGAYLYADGIQALGHFATNLTEVGVDFAAANSYKWLFSSWGAAFFFVREEHLEWLKSDRYGHGQAAEMLPDYRFELFDSARKYEYGGAIYGTVYQLRASLPYLKKVGLGRIEQHTVALAQDLRNGVADLGFDTWTPPNNPSPIVSFAHGRDRKEVEELFDKEGIVVTFREEGGSVVRVAISLFNNENDIRHLLKVLGTIA